jgi:hypothetical protein
VHQENAAIKPLSMKVIAQRTLNLSTGRLPVPPLPVVQVREGVVEGRTRNLPTDDVRGGRAISPQAGF